MDWFSIFKSISMHFSSHHSSCIFISEITIPFHNNIVFWLFLPFLLCLRKCQSGTHAQGGSQAAGTGRTWGRKDQNITFSNHVFFLKASVTGLCQRWHSASRQTFAPTRCRSPHGDNLMEVVSARSNGVSLIWYHDQWLCAGFRILFIAWKHEKNQRDLFSLLRGKHLYFPQKQRGIADISALYHQLFLSCRHQSGHSMLRNTPKSMGFVNRTHVPIKMPFGETRGISSSLALVPLSCLTVQAAQVRHHPCSHAKLGLPLLSPWGRHGKCSGSSHRACYPAIYRPRSGFAHIYKLPWFEMHRLQWKDGYGFHHQRDPSFSKQIAPSATSAAFVPFSKLIKKYVDKDEVHGWAQGLF